MRFQLKDFLHLYISSELLNLLLKAFKSIGLPGKLVAMAHKAPVSAHITTRTSTLILFMSSQRAVQRCLWWVYSNRRLMMMSLWGSWAALTLGKSERLIRQFWSLKKLGWDHRVPGDGLREVVGGAEQSFTLLSDPPEKSKGFETMAPHSRVNAALAWGVERLGCLGPPWVRQPTNSSLLAMQPHNSK